MCHLRWLIITGVFPLVDMPHIYSLKKHKPKSYVENHSRAFNCILVPILDTYFLMAVGHLYCREILQQILRGEKKIYIIYFVFIFYNSFSEVLEN